MPERHENVHPEFQALLSRLMPDKPAAKPPLAPLAPINADMLIALQETILSVRALKTFLMMAGTSPVALNSLVSIEVSVDTIGAYLVDYRKRQIGARS